MKSIFRSLQGIAIAGMLLVAPSIGLAQEHSHDHANGASPANAPSPAAGMAGNGMGMGMGMQDMSMMKQHMGQMMEKMKQIHATSDPDKRSMLMEEQMQSMMDHMQMMMNMMEKMHAGPGSSSDHGAHHPG